MIHLIGSGAASIAMALELANKKEHFIWHGGYNILRSLWDLGHATDKKLVKFPDYGVAYHQEEDIYRLNAEAKGMSLNPRLFQSFPMFLCKRWPERYGDGTAGLPDDAFAFRHEYHAYLTAALNQWAHWMDALCWPASEFDAGTINAADQYILCIGTHIRQSALEDCVNNPWIERPRDYQKFYDATRQPGGTALIVGTGLTAIDTALRLWKKDPTIKITFISRSGRLPRPWLATTNKNLPWLEEVVENQRTGLTTLRGLVNDLHIAALNYGWQNVMASMRPEWKNIWKSLSDKDKQRFLKRVRPFWEIHRHRMIPDVVTTLEQHTYLVMKMKDVTWPAFAKNFGIVYNATGIDLNPERDPLLAKWKWRGYIKYDPSGQGLVSKDCKVGDNIWAIGAYVRPERWEATAMADIVQMVDIVAKQLN